MVAAKNAVLAPITTTKSIAIGAKSKSGEHLTTRKTPAVTIVAA